MMNRIPPLFLDLSKIISGEIDCRMEILNKYSVDLSNYQINPQAVIYPKNTKDIKHVLSFAREYTIPVIIRGAGTGRRGGSLGEGIILDMTRYFNHMRNINMVEGAITVDSGVFVGELLEKLHAWNYDIPFFFGVDKNSTIGAILSTKSCSGSSFRHGTIREWVEELSIVLDNGEEHKLADGITPSGKLLGVYQEIFPLLAKESGTVRASKPKSNDDSTGYNIWNTSIGPRQLIDQIIGSEGTLGIITSATFRITPHKKHSVTTCIPIKSQSLIPVCVDIAKHHKSEHIFLYDETFSQLADRYHTTVVPYYPETPYTLLVTHISEDKEKCHKMAQTFKQSLPVEEYYIKTFEDRKRLERIISGEFLFSLFEAYTNNSLTPSSIADGLIVTVPQIPTLLEKLNEYLESIGRLSTITGYVGSGNISIYTLFDTKEKSYNDYMLMYAKNIFSIIKKCNGGISAEGGDGIDRSAFIEYIYNTQTVNLFEKIKKIWDPFYILNPGKKIGVTTSFVAKHTKR